MEDAVWSPYVISYNRTVNGDESFKPVAFYGYPTARKQTSFSFLFKSETNRELNDAFHLQPLLLAVLEEFLLLAPRIISDVLANDGFSDSKGFLALT
jgi:hypothetical protein